MSRSWANTGGDRLRQTASLSPISRDYRVACEQASLSMIILKSVLLSRTFLFTTLGMYTAQIPIHPTYEF